MSGCTGLTWYRYENLFLVQLPGGTHTGKRLCTGIMETNTKPQEGTRMNSYWYDVTSPVSHLDNRNGTFPAVGLYQSAVNLNTRICLWIFYQYTEPYCALISGEIAENYIKLCMNVVELLSHSMLRLSKLKITQISFCKIDSNKQHHEKVLPAQNKLSFKWSHFRISSTDSKVRTTLYSIINSTTGKYCSVAFI